ncbi:MAG: SgcJ/EcaC family oxidoreductase [Gammaproteobacteria bacterium]|nr:SgcJ/EcaC family oxidoreductase [Gammaproteobacteria bacterium]
MMALLRPCLAVLAMMPITALSQSQPAEADAPQAVVRAMIQAWHDLDVDRVVELFAPDGVFHSVMLEPIVGREALRAHFEPVFAELERVELRTVNMAVDGNVVFFERVDDFVYRGKHSQIPVAGVIEVANGRIQEWRDYYDRATMVEAMTVD